MRCGQGQGTWAADERRTDAADSQAEKKEKNLQGHTLCKTPQNTTEEDSLARNGKDFVNPTNYSFRGPTSMKLGSPGITVTQGTDSPFVFPCECVPH